MLSKFFDGMQYADKEYIAKIYGAESRRGCSMVAEFEFHSQRVRTSQPIVESKYGGTIQYTQGWDTQLDKNAHFSFLFDAAIYESNLPRSTWSNRLEKLLEKEFPIKPKSSRFIVL